MDGVLVQELDIAKYRGKSGANYILSYFRFTFLAFLECTKLLARKSLDVVHVHNMPNFLVFAGLIPLLAGKPIILDVHDTMVETYAAKFAGRFSKTHRMGIALRGGGLLPDGSPHRLRQRYSKGSDGRAEHSRRKRSSSR